mgnify:CR=1 FL=1
MNKGTIFNKLCELFTNRSFPIVGRTCITGSPCDYDYTGQDVSPARYNVRCNEKSKSHDLDDQNTGTRVVYRIIEWVWNIVVEFPCEVDTSEFEQQVLNTVPVLDFGDHCLYIVPGTHRYSPPQTDGGGMTVIFEINIIPEL